MYKNRVKKRNCFFVALAVFLIACICVVFMFAKASFAVPNDATEDQATNDTQEITNAADTPSNDGAKYLYIAGSGIGGVIDNERLDVSSITDGIYKITVVDISEVNPNNFYVGINNSNDENID